MLLPAGIDKSDNGVGRSAVLLHRIYGAAKEVKGRRATTVRPAEPPEDAGGVLRGSAQHVVIGPGMEERWRGAVWWRGAVVEAKQAKKVHDVLTEG